MNARAFIIAIEDYPNSTMLAQTLPNTNKDADEFRNWLITEKQVDPASILACASPACGWRTTGTTHDEIVDELKELSTKWKEDNNDELYFYFSGHGFSYKADSTTIFIDAFVASDFVNTDDSGDACFQFQEIQKKLWSSLGPGNHFYFIDACRNQISEDDIEVPIIGKKFPLSSRGNSKYYVLYSTALGEVAKTNSGFTKFVLQGLKGAGIAKKWDAGKMFVTFERLRDYVKAKLKYQDIEAMVFADGDGFIKELSPVPQYDCEVIVTNGADDDSFDLQISNELITPISRKFQGRSCKVPLKPFDYYLNITHPSAAVVQIDPPPPGPLSLYDPVVVKFKKERIMRSGGSGARTVSVPGGTATVTLEAAPFTEISLEHEASGKKFFNHEVLTAQLSPGTYTAQVIERGTEIQRRSITVEAGKDLVVDLLARPESNVRTSIVNSLSHAPTFRYAEFSETLGPMANWDLSLWLAVFGASHIVSDPEKFRMLRNLPIESFSDVNEGASPVYVLGGFEKSEGPFMAAVSEGANVVWEPLKKVDTLEGIYEKRIDTKPGSQLLSFKVEKQTPVTIAIHGLRNRATFVTFAEDTDGRLKIHQYLLPIHRLFQYLAPEVFGYLDYTPLSVVRTMALAQSRFANNHEVAPGADPEQKRDWDALMYGKWLDPIMSLIACYEIIRRGQVNEQSNLLKVVIGNLRRYFAGIPDTEVIAHQLGMGATIPNEAPLLMDGVLALDHPEDCLPLSVSRLDYSSPWTTWRGAVSDDTRAAAKTASSPAVLGAA
ncbi:MAG TPA: caspase family protein [Pyrinomonadaceae bacterium]|nr:caspase family protein [Pyrinomonadaceae bacterium]